MLVVKELSQNIESHFPDTPRQVFTNMSASYGSQHSSTVHSTPSPAIDADDSSEEEEDSYTLEEAIHVWYEKKTRATRFSYNQYVKHFQSWLHANYGRIIDHRLKLKHVRLYLSHKSKTTTQMRTVISVLKSLFKHLKKLGDFLGRVHVVICLNFWGLDLTFWAEICFRFCFDFQRFEG